MFEQIPALGWALSSCIIKCFLTKEQSKEDGAEDKEGSRGNHQRVQAIEIFGSLIRASTSEEAHVELAKNLPLLTSAVIKVIQTSDSW